MGIRSRIGKISKVAYDKYKDLENEIEVEKAAGLARYGGIYHSLPEYKELYEIGKYVDYAKGTKPFFKFKLEEECEFQIASKEWLLALIEEYRAKTETWYNLLSKALTRTSCGPGDFALTKDGKSSIKSISLNVEMDNTTGEFPALELYNYIQNRKRRWEGRYIKPYNIDKKQNVVSGDWSYEYSVFDLVHIYRTFNWKRNLMIYSVW